MTQPCHLGCGVPVYWDMKLIYMHPHSTCDGFGVHAQEDVMMSEIYHRGPIVCSISTPADFTYGYRGGVYNDPKNYTYESIDHNVEVRHIKLTWAH